MTFLAAFRNKIEQLTSHSDEKELELSFASGLTVNSCPSFSDKTMQEPSKAQFLRSKTASPQQYSCSPGLEAIYALETVDISSVRPLQKKFFEPKEIKIRNQFEEEAKEQLSFPFESQEDEKILSFVLLEPIEVLQLPARLLQLLKENGKKILHDLFNLDLNTLVFIKGIGQGHIDEIQAKLENYTKLKQLPLCSYIELGSWLRTFLAGCTPKKYAALLERYQLPSLFALPAHEANELRALTPEKRRCWEEEALCELEKGCKDIFFDQLGKVTKALIAPWIRRRGGIASHQEVLELFITLADDIELVEPLLAFFSDVFCYGSFPLTERLIGIEHGQVAAEVGFKELYEDIVSSARSYFPTPATCYKVDDLCGLICCEFACEWKDPSCSAIKNILSRSSHFLLYKDPQWGLVVRAQ